MDVTGITDAEAEKAANTSGGEQPTRSRRGARNSTGRRKRTEPDKTTLLQILESIVVKWEEAGGTFSLLNTDLSGRRALGLVLDDAFVCEKCGHLLVRNVLGVVCKTCAAKSGTNVREVSP